ncbi:MAG: hypothetical protein WCK35_02310 [Chloroflexota bacterium]
MKKLIEVALPLGAINLASAREKSFQREPDFGVTSVNYNFAELLARAGEPS